METLTLGVFQTYMKDDYILVTTDLFIPTANRFARLISCAKEEVEEGSVTLSRKIYRDTGMSLYPKRVSSIKLGEQKGELYLADNKSLFLFLTQGISTFDSLGHEIRYSLCPVKEFGAQLIKASESCDNYGAYFGSMSCLKIFIELMEKKGRSSDGFKKKYQKFCGEGFFAKVPKILSREEWLLKQNISIDELLKQKVV